MLSLATGKIVTRDQFKILSMPQSVIATLNAMAMKEGKKITQTQLHVLDELLFANSLDKSKMHPSLPTPPIRMPLSTPDQWTDPHLPICHQLTAFSRFLPSMCVCVCVYVCVCVGGGGRGGQSQLNPRRHQMKSELWHSKELGCKNATYLQTTPPPLTPSPEPNDTPADTPSLDSEAVAQQHAQPVQPPLREQRRVPVST